MNERKQEAADAVRAWVADNDRAARELAVQYESLSADGRRAVTMLDYVCSASPSHCSLFSIWMSRGRHCWYVPGFTLKADTALSQTAERARAKRTSDGLRRWVSRAGTLDDFVEYEAANEPLAPMPEVGVSLNCRHIRNGFLSSERLVSDLLTATVGNPRRIVIPTRSDTT